MNIPNPYAVSKVGAATYAVGFRCIIAGKMSFRRVCGGASENDAKLVAKLLNQNWEKSNDKE